MAARVTGTQETYVWRDSGQRRCNGGQVEALMCLYECVGSSCELLYCEWQPTGQGC